MFIDVLEVLLYVVFTLSSLLLIVVILLQEGKGGGLAAAFGGAGGDAFGVGTGGINKFTSILAAVFIGSAILLASLSSGSAALPSDEPVNPETPAEGAPEDPSDVAPEGGTG